MTGDSTAVHLDVTADDREAEVKRLRALGAEPRRDFTDDGSWTWTVMADPDGNEFCVTDPWFPHGARSVSETDHRSMLR